jgi:hypothetical protein
MEAANGSYLAWQAEYSRDDSKENKAAAFAARWFYVDEFTKNEAAPLRTLTFQPFQSIF